MKIKVVYGAAINLRGLWGPYKMKYYEDLDEYYDKTGNFSIKKVGEHQPCDGIITFASASRAKTQTWVQGVRATMRALKGWCS